MRAKAIYACVAENTGEVTFNADDCLTNVADSTEDGWLVGTVNATGDRGLFPVVYTELTPESGDDTRFLQKLQRSGLLSSALNLNQFARDLGSSSLRSRPPPPPLPSSAATLLSQLPPPPVPTKPLLSLAPRPGPPLAPKPAMKPKPDSSPAVYQSHQQQKQQQKQQQRPALPLKPVNIDYSDPESRRQKEREAAEQWESKFGIGSANPSKNTPPVATTTTTKPATILPKPTLAPKPTTLIKPKPGFIPPQSESPKSIHPSAENDAPKLPFSSARSAVLERMAQQRQKDEQVAASNPALENTPPPLPYSASRRTIAEPFAAPIIERAIQPNPRQLIAQLNNSNGNGNARGAGGRAFEDNFDPLVHTVSASISSSSTHRPSATPSPPTALLGNGGGVPLTLAREVRGTRPPAPPSPAVTSRSSTAIAGGMAHRQPVLPPKPAKQQLSSASSRSVSFASHHPGYAHQPPESSSTTTPTLLSPALSFSSSSNGGGGGGGFQSPLTTTIHRSSVKPDAIPADALARYAHLFKRLDKQHGKRGFLNADEVHAVVVRCRLPDDLLRRIWALSDRNLNGKFGPAEFYIIMHLTDCALRQEPIPEQLSVDLLRSAYQS